MLSCHTSSCTVAQSRQAAWLLGGVFQKRVGLASAQPVSTSKLLDGRKPRKDLYKPFTKDNLAKWQQSCEVLSMARQNSLRLRSTGAFSRAPKHLQSLLPGLMLMDYEPPLGSWPSGNSDPFWVTWHKHVAGNMWRKKGTVWCWVATEADFIGEPVVPVLSFWNSCHCGWQTLKFEILASTIDTPICTCSFCSLICASRHQTLDSGCSFLTPLSKSTDLNPAIAVTMHGVTTQTSGMGITMDTAGINSSMTSVGRAIQWQVAVDLLHYMEDMNHDRTLCMVSCNVLQRWSPV